MSEIAADADAETARIAVLMAFGTQPKRDADTDWLLAHCDAATYALATDHLPTGGWISQGYPYECAAMVTVPVHSHEAESAANNSSLLNRDAR